MSLAIPVSLLTDLEAEIEDLSRRLLPGVVAVRNGNGDGGSGVIWAPDLIITNDHVVHHDTCRIQLIDGQEISARVIARDSGNDLAALRLGEPVSGGAHTFSSGGHPRSTLRIGQVVLALGHPMGAEWAVTTGILSRVSAPSDERPLLRASITLLPGNSGGPLVDLDGALVGINAMVSGPAEAIAVPIDVVRMFVNGIDTER